MLHLASVLAVVLGITSSDSSELRREALMTALRSGGYTVILRHARTDRSFQEERSYVPKERSAQRNLTDEGIRDAALMGVVFRKYGIAFAEIISSPMYRTVETAEMAAGTPRITMALRSIPSTPEQAALIRTPPTPGTNRLLVTHHFVIETHVPGIEPGEIGESEAAVVRHAKDGNVELVGRITLDDWNALANPGGAQAQPAATTISGHGAPYPAHPSPANNTSASTTANIPDTHAGHLAREYIGAFNSGNAGSMRAYLESYMIPNPARSTDERLASYASLFEQHGPLSVLSVERSESTELVLGMGSKRGRFRLTVTSSEAQPMRASSVTFAFTQGAHP